jgi:hypothetical protein
MAQRQQCGASVRVAARGGRDGRCSSQAKGALVDGARAARQRHAGGRLRAAAATRWDFSRVADGQVYLLRKGRDFDVEVGSLAIAASRWAHEHGYRLVPPDEDRAGLVGETQREDYPGLGTPASGSSMRTGQTKGRCAYRSVRPLVGWRRQRHGPRSAGAADARGTRRVSGRAALRRAPRSRTGPHARGPSPPAGAARLRPPRRP